MAHVRSLVSRRPLAALPTLWLAGNLMAAFDTCMAALYWAPQGVGATRVLQTFAAWVTGPAAYAAGAASAMAGALLYGQMLAIAALAFHGLARHLPALHRHPIASGTAYGTAIYLAIFHLLAPLITGHSEGFGNLEWTATCLTVFVFAIGIPMAWLSAALSRQEDAGQKDAAALRQAGFQNA